MTPVDPASSTQPAGSSEDDLHALLLEAERRNQAAYQSKGRALTLIFRVTVFSILGWAAYVYFQNQSNSTSPQVDQAVPLESPKETDTSEFDIFRPESMRVGDQGPHATTAHKTGPLVDTEDIRFAVELLNFIQPAAGREADKEAPKTQ